MTTELIGVDGNAYAPFPSRRDLEDYVVLNGGLDGRPDIALDWSTVAEYLGRFDQRTSVNVAYVVGNSPLRIASVGWDEIEADRAAMADQRSRLREALEDGAFGMSTGLDYPPGSYATTGGARRAGRRGRPARRDLPHPRPVPAGRRVPRPVPGGDRDRASVGAPVHITHFYHRPTFPGPPEVMLALVDDARAEGLDVTFDLYPYEWASTRLLIMLPNWMQAGGLGRCANASPIGRFGPGSARSPGRGAASSPGNVLGRGAPGLLRAPRERGVGGPDARRVPGRDWPRPGGRDLRPAARRGSPDQPGDPGAPSRGHRARSSGTPRR